ncbi:MAG: TetR/AcrR family transcriptional regulator [Pseudonocardia sp.]|nr:TetR/AcrR family transcriptional regulator [Pseudonocardia sp.]
MPRQVDHAQRRRQIADALWRVADEQGLDAVSLRRVAAEAGVSMGLVQHYFASRDEMLLFAMEAVGERVARECGAALAEMADPGPRDRVGVLLRQWLPADEQRRREARSQFAFLVGGVGGPAGTFLRDGMAMLRAHVEAEIVADGHAPDPRGATTILLALAEGLSAHVLGGHLAPEEAGAALEAGIASAFGPA